MSTTSARTKEAPSSSRSFCKANPSASSSARLCHRRRPSTDAIQIAHGLAAAHGKGIVHRDVKPENVFITKAGHVKILDFGVAKLLPRLDASGADTQTPTESVTQPGTVVGTVAYMSPEQVRGQPVDARSDLFSLGAVLYEMLSGRRPFQRDTAPEILTAILREEPADLAEANRNVPAGLENVVRRCLEKEPDRRFQSAGDVAFGLEAQRGISVEKPVAPKSAAGVFLHRHRVAVAAAALLAVIAVAAGWWWRTRGGPASGLKRLAVLPFENLSGDPGQEYLSDGLTQEMIAQLGRLHPASLSVIARTSVMQYKKTTKPIDQIGRELGVDYILEGSARHEAGRVRITAELIEVRRQVQLWADSFDRELSGILALQNDVSQKVARALALKLLPAEQARLANARSMNPEAYEAYLKGLHHWYKVTPADLDTAQRYFEVALTKDPNYALAHAGIALVWAGRSQMGVMSPAETGPKAVAAAARAIELDEGAAEPHYALAVIRAWVDWDWTGSEKKFARAIELNPNFPDARAYYSHVLMYMGRPEEAMRQAKRALELDPFNTLIQTLYSVDLIYLRRWDDAAAQARIGLKTAPDDVLLPGLLWFCYSRKGMYKEAFDAAKTNMKMYDDRSLDEALELGFRETGYRGAMTRGAEALAGRFRKGYANPTDIALHVRRGRGTVPGRRLAREGLRSPRPEHAVHRLADQRQPARRPALQGPSSKDEPSGELTERMSLSAGTSLGPYEILSPLGAGDGRGLPGSGHAARTRRGCQGAARGRCERSTRAGPLRERGAGRRRPLAPEHPRPLRRRERGCRLVRRHGASGRRDASATCWPEARCRFARPSTSRCRWRKVSRRRTGRGSSTATSSPRTSS